MNVWEPDFTSGLSRRNNMNVWEQDFTSLSNTMNVWEPDFTSLLNNECMRCLHVHVHVENYMYRTCT